VLPARLTAMNALEPMRSGRLRDRAGRARAGVAARARGFTLIELMVTIAVAAILTALAVPAFNTFMENDRLLTQSSALVSALDLARSEAIKADTSVSVCPSTDAMTCSGASDWSGGYIVLSAAGGPPLQSVGAQPSGVTLNEANNLTAVTFLSSGLTTLLASNAPSAQFTMCDGRGAADARYTEVQVTGRVASSQTPGQNLTGGALACP